MQCVQLCKEPVDEVTFNFAWPSPSGSGSFRDLVSTTLRSMRHPGFGRDLWGHDHQRWMSVRPAKVPRAET